MAQWLGGNFTLAPLKSFFMASGCRLYCQGRTYLFYSERQKKVDIVFLAFPRKIPLTRLTPPSPARGISANLGVFSF